MKSCMGMIMVFIGMYIILYYDILGFLAQPFMFKFSLVLATTMLVGVVIALFVLAKIRGGGDDEKNNDLP